METPMKKKTPEAEIVTPHIEVVSKDLIASGFQALRVEQDAQQDFAIAHRRDIKEVVQKANELLETFPEFAESAFYAIPYKDRDDGGNDKTTWVMGPSVKAATELAKLYGNQANGSRVIGDRDDRVIVQGVFVDYETNSRTYREWSVLKQTWSRAKSEMVPMRADRLNTAIMSGMSKACRNAILAGLPAMLVQSFYKKCVEIAEKNAVGGAKWKRGGGSSSQSKPSGKAPDKQKEPNASEREKILKSKLENMVKVFATEFKVEKKVLMGFIGTLAFKNDAKKVLEHMGGLRNALKDGQTSVGAVFGIVEDLQRTPATEPHQMTIDEILGTSGKK